MFILLVKSLSAFHTKELIQSALNSAKVVINNVIKNEI